MNRTLNRLKILFVALFVLLSLSMFGYHYVWVWPKERCEARGGAWAGKWLKCATIYPIETITRRPLNTPPLNGQTDAPPAAPAATPTPAPAKK